MDAEGMLLLENLTRAYAIEIQEARDYPPAGNDPGVCYAVPMETGRWCHQMWDEYATAAQRKLRDDRKTRMHQMLKSYDGYSKDRNPTLQEELLTKLADLAAAANASTVNIYWGEASLSESEEKELRERTFQSLLAFKEIGPWAHHQMADAAREAASGYAVNRELDNE